MSSESSVEIFSSISLYNSKTLSEPLVLQYDDVVTEAADYSPNALTLCVLVLLTCTDVSDSGNVVSSMIVMVLVFE